MKIQDRKRRQKMENIEKLSKTKSNKEDKSGESLLGKSRHGKYTSLGGSLFAPRWKQVQSRNNLH